MIHLLRSRLLGLAAGALVLAGCVTAEGYRQNMERFIGATADVMLIEWGEPSSRSRLDDGGEVWSYFREERRYHAGGYRTIPRERRVTFRDGEGVVRERIEQYEETVYDPPREWFVECETRFVLSPERRVVNFRFAGEGCVAEEIY